MSATADELAGTPAGEIPEGWSLARSVVIRIDDLIESEDGQWLWSGDFAGHPTTPAGLLEGKLRVIRRDHVPAVEPTFDEVQAHLEDLTRGAMKAIAPNGPSGLPPGAEVWALMVGMQERDKATRATDKLRAHRKRHAQRLAAMQAKLDEAEATIRAAMEIVMHVASGRAGTFAMIHFDHEIYLKARALVQYTVPRETAPHGQATK